MIDIRYWARRYDTSGAPRASPRSFTRSAARSLNPDLWARNTASLSLIIRRSARSATSGNHCTSLSLQNSDDQKSLDLDSDYCFSTSKLICYRIILPKSLHFWKIREMGTKPNHGPWHKIQFKEISIFKFSTKIQISNFQFSKSKQ